MPWNWRKLRCAIGGRCLAGSSEQETQQSNNSTCSDVVQTLSKGRRISANNATNALSEQDNQMVGTRLKRETPVLFCTSRGLHLRVARPITNTDNTSSHSQHKPTDTAYEIRFCDLERWSTNRANTVCLEDTFTVRPRNTNERQLESMHRNGQCWDNHISFALPVSTQSMSFATRSRNNNRECSIQNTFARFGIE